MTDQPARIPAADARPGMVVEITVRGMILETEQSYHGPVRLTLAGDLGLEHRVVLNPDTQLTRIQPKGRP